MSSLEMSCYYNKISWETWWKSIITWSIRHQVVVVMNHRKIDSKSGNPSMGKPRRTVMGILQLENPKGLWCENWKRNQIFATYRSGHWGYQKRKENQTDFFMMMDLYDPWTKTSFQSSHPIALKIFHGPKVFSDRGLIISSISFSKKKFQVISTIRTNFWVIQLITIEII